MPSIKNILSVSVPGIGKLPLAEKAGTFTPSGKKREYKPGRQPGDGGHTETHTPAKLELNLNLQKGLDIYALNDIEDADITVRLSDGSVHMMSQASSENPTPVGDGDGKVVFFSDISERIA